MGVKVVCLTHKKCMGACCDILLQKLLDLFIKLGCFDKKKIIFIVLSSQPSKEILDCCCKMSYTKSIGWMPVVLWARREQKKVLDKICKITFFFMQANPTLVEVLHSKKNKITTAQTIIRRH